MTHLQLPDLCRLQHLTLNCSEQFCQYCFMQILHSWLLSSLHCLLIPRAIGPGLLKMLTLSESMQIQWWHQSIATSLHGSVRPSNGLQPSSISYFSQCWSSWHPISFNNTSFQEKEWARSANSAQDGMLRTTKLWSSSTPA